MEQNNFKIIFWDTAMIGSVDPCISSCPCFFSHDLFRPCNSFQKQSGASSMFPNFIDLTHGPKRMGPRRSENLPNVADSIMKLPHPSNLVLNIAMRCGAITLRHRILHEMALCANVAPLNTEKTPERCPKPKPGKMKMSKEAWNHGISGYLHCKFVQYPGGAQSNWRFINKQKMGELLVIPWTELQKHLLPSKMPRAWRVPNPHCLRTIWNCTTHFWRVRGVRGTAPSVSNTTLNSILDILIFAMPMPRKTATSMLETHE